VINMIVHNAFCINIVSLYTKAFNKEKKYLHYLFRKNTVIK
jgi:hypothetical protein